MTARRAAPAALLLLLAVSSASCGGSSSPTSPNPTPVPGSPVSAFVFYDENGSGVPDPGEVVRLPGVTVAVGGMTGQSTTGGGAVVVSNVPAGTQSASIRPETLPAYFTAGPAQAVQVPQAAGLQLALPATLAIGTNRPNVYMAFGDSISAGDGSSDGTGYRGYLQASLQTYWGRATIVNEGLSGSKSSKGDERMGDSLNRTRPAYSLILYGTNDWNEAACRNAFPCDTIQNLRSMIGQARALRSFPVLGTIPPVNPAFLDKAPAERNDWVARMDDLIRPLARQEGVALADIQSAFLKEPDLPSLYSDFLHPNDRGYSVLAREFFKAITQPLAAPGTASYRLETAAGNLFRPPSLPPAPPPARAAPRKGR